MEKSPNDYLDKETLIKLENISFTQNKDSDILIKDKILLNENPNNLININENKFSSNDLETQDSKEFLKGVREVRLAVIGNVDSGKSTLVGVLTKCILDDGRGAARQLIFNFEHEKENGRTSSIAHEIMGFKSNLQVEPHKASDKKNTAWNKILKESDKVISIIDLCGHEKYLKTTIFGLTGLVPDYAMIIIGANMGVQRMTKEHLGITLALKIPIFVVITKIDIAPSDIYKQTLEYISKVLKSTGAQKLPVVIREHDDVAVYAESILSDRVCPIFCVSNVTGEGIKQLKCFISLLMSRTTQVNTFKPPSDKVEFLIDGAFNVKGVGLVFSGTLVSGKVTVGQNLMFVGPDSKGEFKQVTVKSIHYKRTPVDEISSGNFCCFHVKSKDNIKQSDLRKGMILLDKETNYRTVLEFEAEVMIFIMLLLLNLSIKL